MSAVEIASVAVSALALLLACLLLVSARAGRRRTADLQAAITALSEQVSVSTGPRPEPPVPVVHTLEPYATRVDEQGRTIATPTTAQVVDATLDQPLVRAATLGYGLRRALRPESRDRITGMVRREFRRRRALRRKAGRRAARFAVVPTVKDRPVEQERAS